ncbi:hypothetical protein [Phaeospirillum tilakii]|uniref:Bbp19-like phage domain-containing protein n=1 Tax=Phaeospirillum tilakii TaxID=741673 RepID=A0ABW5C5Y8_9PROT
MSRRRPDPTFAADDVPPAKTDLTPEEADLAAVLATPAGRRVLRRIVAQADPLRPAGVGDPIAAAYIAGGRDLALILAGWVRAAAPEHLPVILLEA